MAKIKIDKNKCKGCMLCIATCPRNLIAESKRLNRRGIHFAEFRDGGRCTGCSLCAVICPEACIEVWR